MATKIIVTHKSPDLDAVSAVWLLKRFDEANYATAPLGFVAPGDQMSLEELSQFGLTSVEATHVDTGGGQFDHHSSDKASEDICATSLVFDYLCQLKPALADDAALVALVSLVTQVDHFAQGEWPERNDSRAYMYLFEILPGLKNIGLTDEQVVEYALVSLDVIYARLGTVMAASEQLESAQTFTTPWGDAVAQVTNNPYFVDVAQRQGYVLAVSKDADYGHIRIKALPGKGVDLSKIYEKINDLDSNASWYLHPGKTMLLNGSDPSRGQVASKLHLEQIIKLFREL